MRVRTRRFVELRSRGQPRYAEAVEVANGESHVDELRRVHPPAAAVVSHDCGSALGETPRAKLAIDGRATPPLFEVNGSEPVPNPFVQVRKDSRRIRQAEVLLPTQQVATESHANLGNA